jgi:biotin operon repressor
MDYHGCMTKYYVYAHANEEHGVFYVGKGSGDRLYTTGNRNKFWKRITKKYGYEAKIIEECDTEDAAFAREIYWIAHYKSLGQCEANFSLGGDGVTVEARWWGEKISESLSGISRPKGKESKTYKDFIDENNLQKLYVNKNFSTIQISKMFGVSSTTVWERLKQYQIPIKPIDQRGKKIICTDTGEEFDSITAAARSLNLFRENIRKVLSGKYKTTGGLHFKYKE